MTYGNSKPEPEQFAKSPSRWFPAPPLFLLQPVLRRIVHRIARDNPDMFARLGPHFSAAFIIDPVDLPMVLLLHPDPDNLVLRACPRNNIPPHDARISGRFLDLLMLVDGDADGDAMFFSRDLTITGNTEAVVCLRNALDDIDGSIATSVADMFAAPGRVTLAALRRAQHRTTAAKGNTG